MNNPEMAQKEIWELEQQIYTARAEGDLNVYIDHASEKYIAPSHEKGWFPKGLEFMRSMAEKFSGSGCEKLDMKFKGFTVSGDTAVIYYINHRTMLPDGEPVDQWYEVMHIWVREASSWKLLASMPRELIDYDDSKSN